MNLTRGTYNVVRSIVVTVLVAIVAIVALAYLLLLLPPVQQRLCDEGEKALSEYLNTEVNIGSVSVTPFNQLELKEVLIHDQQGDSLLVVDKLGAGISLKDLIADHRIVVTYGEIIGLKGHVTRLDKSSPTNVQFIIDAFKPKDDQPPKPFDVEVNTPERGANVAIEGEVIGPAVKLTVQRDTATTRNDVTRLNRDTRYHAEDLAHGGGIGIKVNAVQIQ